MRPSAQESSEERDRSHSDDVLRLLAEEHRELLHRLQTLEGDSPGGTAEQLVESFLSHFAMEEEVLGPAFQTMISCATAWRIMNDTVEEHRTLRRRIELLSNRLLPANQRSGLLKSLREDLIRQFEDQEARLFDEARRHLSPQQRSDLAGALIFARRKTRRV